jgi:hypothetical protein
MGHGIGPGLTVLRDQQLGKVHINLRTISEKPYNVEYYYTGCVCTKRASLISKARTLGASVPMQALVRKLNSLTIQ